MKSFTLSGARLKLVINNATIGFITGFNYAVDYGKKSIRGIDDPFPQEIASGQQTIRGSVRCLRLKDVGGLEAYGIVAEQASTTQPSSSSGQAQRLSDIQIEKYINMQLIERGTDKVIFKIDKATVMNQQWAVNARGLMEGSFDFEGFLQAPLT